MEQTTIAVRQIIFWSITASALIIVLRAQIVRVVFGSGQFGWQGHKADRRRYGDIRLFHHRPIRHRYFYQGFLRLGENLEADNDKCRIGRFYHRPSSCFYQPDKKPLFSFFFFEIALRVGDVGGADMLALPMAYSLGMIINSVLLFLLFQKEFGEVWVSARKLF